MAKSKNAVRRNSTAKANGLHGVKGKAVVVLGPRKAVLKEMVFPKPRPYEVLIKVAYEGVCGTDLEVFEGHLGYFKSGMSKFPLTPGHEFSGSIVERGKNVKSVKAGDRVVVECIQGCGECEQCRSANPIACRDRKEVGVMKLNGGYSEYVVVPARFVHHVPEGIHLKMAAICEPLAVVHKGVTRLNAFASKMNYGDDVEYAVIGGGPIGYLSAQLLASFGRRVVVYDKHPKRRRYYRNPLIRTESNMSKLYKSRVFVEATGDPDALHELLDNSSTGATFLLLGLPYSRRDFSFESVVAFDKTIIGSVGSSSVDFAAALRLLPQLDVRPLLESVVPLKDYAQAWESFARRKFLKTILEVNQ